MEKSKSSREEMQKQPWEPEACQEVMGRGEKHYKMHLSAQGGEK